jgi:hypothetical protein
MVGHNQIAWGLSDGVYGFNIYRKLFLQTEPNVLPGSPQNITLRRCGNLKWPTEIPRHPSFRGVQGL